MMEKLLALTLVVFMVGSLLEMGLRLDIRQALVALRNVRFVFWTVILSFFLCPAFALLLTKIIPLAEPYAIGLLFLGMAPCAPFVPLLSQRAHGDLAYAAAFMLLAAVGTVAYMPLMTPVLIKGFTADAWTIAKPLLFFIAAPLVFGILVRRASESFAHSSHPIVKKVTGVDTIVMLVIVMWIYWGDILSAVGSYAIATQFLFYGVVALAAYGLGFGLTHSQKSALVLGACTRNIGAAFVPVVSVAGTDQRSITMVVMAVPISVVCGFATAHLLAHGASKPTRSTSVAG